MRETATAQISTLYRELIETANLDWQVAEYVHLIRTLCDHSANEVKAAAVQEIAYLQNGRETFDEAVAKY